MGMKASTVPSNSLKDISTTFVDNPPRPTANACTSAPAAYPKFLDGFSRAIQTEDPSADLAAAKVGGCRLGAAMEGLGSGRPILTVHRNTFSPALTAAASRPSWRARSSVLLSACGQDCFMARHVSEDCPSLPSPRSQTDGLARRRSRRAGIEAPHAAICIVRTKSSPEAPSPSEARADTWRTPRDEDARRICIFVPYRIWLRSIHNPQPHLF